MKHVALALLVACSSSAAPTTEPPKPVPVVAAPKAASPAPKIEAAKAKARVAQLGVTLDVDVAITLAERLQDKEWVEVKASCKLEGEWYGGSGHVRTRDLLPGTSVVPVDIRIGMQHAFTQPPTECHLGFRYDSFVVRPRVSTELARMCWTGGEVTNQPCATAPSDAMTVSGLRLEPPRYRRTLGAPITLDAEIDAQLARSLDDSTIYLAASCTLPDGTRHASTKRVPVYGVHTGRPFTGRTYLFGRDSQLTDVPASCTLAVEVADRMDLVRAPVSTWCWRDGAATAGACS